MYSVLYSTILYCIVLSGPCRVTHLFTIMICVQVESETERQCILSCILLYCIVLSGPCMGDSSLYHYDMCSG